MKKIYNKETTWKRTKCFKDKIVLPQSLVRPMIDWYHHNLNYTGARRTLNIFNEHFYFPNMERFINNFVKQCSIYARTKIPVKKYDHLPLLSIFMIFGNMNK